MYKRGKHPNSLKNLKPENGFSKGLVPWNKGLTYTPEQKENIVKANLKRKGHTPWNKGVKGYTFPDTSKMKGRKPWNYGKPDYDRRGENHPRWKGGVGRHDLERKRFESIEWRNKVFERDNYTCQECGIQGKLECHHIKLWSKYPEYRYDVNNGITLCKKCHRQIRGKEEEFEDKFKLLIKKTVNSGKLLTDNAEDNPEPSLDSNILEGATTRDESHVDNNFSKSAVPERDDIV